MAEASAPAPTARDLIAAATAWHLGQTAPEGELVFEFAPEPEPIPVGYPVVAVAEPTFDVNPRWLAEQIARAAEATLDRKMTGFTGRLPD